MTESPIFITSTRRVMECRSDACGQNSERCPCPEACLVPEDEPVTAAEAAKIWALLVAYCAVAFAVVVFFSQ